MSITVADSARNSSNFDAVERSGLRFDEDMEDFRKDLSEVLGALREEAAELSHWAYLAADTPADNAAVERIVTRIFNLMDRIDATASVQGAE